MFGCADLFDNQGKDDAVMGTEGERKISKRKAICFKFKKRERQISGRVCDYRKECKEQVSKRNAVCSMDFGINLDQLDSSSRIFLENKGREGNELEEKAVVSGYLAASFTVEASLIMIAVLMAIFLCIYYGFILHDKTMLEEVSWQTAQKAALYATENSNMETGDFDWEALQKKGLLWRLSRNPVIDPQTISSYLKTRIAGELFACDEPTVQISSSAGNVQIFYEAHIRLPLFSAMQIFGVPSSLSGSVQVKESKQEEFIRLVRGIIWDQDKKETSDE